MLKIDGDTPDLKVGNVVNLSEKMTIFLIY